MLRYAKLGTSRIVSFRTLRNAPALAFRNVTNSTQTSPSTTTAISNQERKNGYLCGKHMMQQRIGTRDIKFSSGKISLLTDGSVIVESGETMVLVTAVSLVKESEEPDFIPLQVDFRDRAAAIGRIPTTHARREMGNTEREILIGRMIDRAIRPLFPIGYHFDTQIIATLLSSDGQIDPDILGLNGASLSLAISDIPWHGPIGAVRIGYMNGEYIVNPSQDQRQQSQLDIVVAGCDEKIIMIDATANEIPPEILMKAIQCAQPEIKKMIKCQKEFAAAYGKMKRKVKLQLPSAELQSAVVSLALEDFSRILTDFSLEKVQRESALQNIKKETYDQLKIAFPDTSRAEMESAIDDIEKNELRQLVIKHHRRCDGRSLEEIRPLQADTSILPDMVHGSSIFERGRTQALCSVTLDDMELAINRLDPLMPTKSFFVHYEFPPYAVNETGKIGRSGRRELGHGALAERALQPVLPDPQVFPYAVRLVSEITSSNGSSSMATVCGGSLSLMDAGVPIKRHVAGITCGLVSENDTFILLTDIAGIEDHLGDMDLKLAGTECGITAIQMDLKIPGIQVSLLEKAIHQACRGRDRLLHFMSNVLSNPRGELKARAPKMATVTFNPLLRSALIGVGGTNLRAIEKKTGVQLQILEEKHQVVLFGRSEDGMKEAKRLINAVAGEIEYGVTYSTKVNKVTDMGVYVVFDDYPGREGYLHISECHADQRQKKPEDEFTIGRPLQVKALGYDAKGILLVTMKAIHPGTSAMLYSQLIHGEKQ